MSTVEITCACGCGRKKQVRTADVKRGWGKFYSKSCKALAQYRSLPRWRKEQLQEQREWREANHEF